MADFNKGRYKQVKIQSNLIKLLNNSFKDNSQVLKLLNNLECFEIKLDFDTLTQQMSHKWNAFIIKKDIVKLKEQQMEEKQVNLSHDTSINDINNSKMFNREQQNENYMNIEDNDNEDDEVDADDEEEEIKSNNQSDTNQFYISNNIYTSQQSRIQSSNNQSQGSQISKFRIEENILFCLQSQNTEDNDRLKCINKQSANWRDIKEKLTEQDCQIKLDHFVNFYVFDSLQEIIIYIKRLILKMERKNKISLEIKRDINQIENNGNQDDFQQKLQAIENFKDQLFNRLKLEMDNFKGDNYLYFETYSNNEEQGQPKFGDDYPHKMRKYKQAIIQIVKFNQTDECNQDIKFSIIKKIHYSHKVSPYACYRNCEQKLKEICYNSLKDIIRYSNFEDLHKDEKCERSTFIGIMRMLRHKKNKRIFKNEFTKEQIQNILYKNLAAIGLLPVNIHFQRMTNNKILLSLSKFLSIPYVMDFFNFPFSPKYHLTLQAMNKHYSFGHKCKQYIEQRVSFFECKDINEYESNLSLDSEYIKVKIIDFFPLNSCIRNLSGKLENAIKQIQEFSSTIIEEVTKLTEILNKKNDAGIGFHSHYYEEEQQAKENLKQLFYNKFQESDVFKVIKDISFDTVNKYKIELNTVFKQWANIQTYGGYKFQTLENNCQTSISEFINHIVRYTYENQDGIDPNFVKDYKESQQYFTNKNYDCSIPLDSDKEYFQLQEKMYKQNKSQCKKDKKQLNLMKQEFQNNRNAYNSKKIDQINRYLENFEKVLQNQKKIIQQDKQFYSGQFDWIHINQIKKTQFEQYVNVFETFKSSKIQQELKEYFYPFQLCQIIPFHNYFSEKSHASYMRLLKNGEKNIELFYQLVDDLFIKDQVRQQVSSSRIIAKIKDSCEIDYKELKEQTKIDLETFKQMKSLILEAIRKEYIPQQSQDIKNQHSTNQIQENSVLLLEACEQWYFQRKKVDFSQYDQNKSIKFHVKDIIKELSYYYYNSVRLQNSISNLNNNSFQCIGYLICKNKMNE